MCWRKTREVVPQFIYLPSLFSFPLHPPFPIRIIFHLIFLMLPEELYGSLVFLFISGLGTLPKLNTDTISGSPVAYQFLECCPPGLDQSTKITWKLWLAQPPVTLFSFFFFFFPYSFESWVILWKGGNDRKGLEAAILGHSLSRVCIIRNISFYACFSVESVAPIIISIIFVVIFIRIESICYVSLSTFFLFSPHGCSTNLLMKYLFIILLICNSTVDQKYKKQICSF